MSGSLEVVGAVSYGLGAALHGVFTILLLTAWRGRLQGGLLLCAAAGSFLWCLGWLFTQLGILGPGWWGLGLLEVGRYGLWMLFLAGLLGWRAGGTAPAHGVPRLVLVSLLASLALCAAVGAQTFLDPAAASAPVVASDATGARKSLLGLVALTVVGLAWVEQVYRNTRPDHRWAVKPLCLGLGGLLAFDFYLYSGAVLFGAMDAQLVLARGAVNALAVPFLAVSAARSPDWSLEIFVSRQIVFHSVAILGAGTYLLGMAAAGYYIKTYGGTWGTFFQVVFLFAAALLLFFLLFSGQVRSRARVFLRKHFFRNKYDYREEWLRFTHTLSTSRSDTELRENILRGIAEIVESEGGAMWVRQSSDRFTPAAEWRMRAPPDAVLAPQEPLARFLREREWIVSLDEFASGQQSYPGLSLPAWLTGLPRAWIIVPLKEREELLGFIVLTRPASAPALDWEVCDLLKTVGRQAAGHLALLEATRALADARQFDAFNRLSAFVVHDLNNLVAQLALVSANAKRLQSNPRFVEDAMGTVENVTARMNRMLVQLRKGRLEDTTSRLITIGPVVQKVIALCAVRSPEPRCTRLDTGAMTTGDPEQLATILEHLVKNAQEATPDSGRIELRVCCEDGWVTIEVEDTGSGMDAKFISERLFRPFDTTKGNAGMGIGVYEAREFARAHGGDLEVESAVGRGTLFRLRLSMEDAGDAAPSPDTTLREAVV